ncbi:hypothetical protein MMF93_08335 [Streptomyces tubbatahanensis]|uniref:Integral membrane protein n=1 Tax=Streptomyces tubbatahanensis TaxID=2923272 RepID=A0ABY3XPY4_9ACTN|nr:hypothetical protein [Streptomyces tubbatahanensis]UNS96512.1 hypothetical protein MMF93_08335 [Streptomyces tubbatahanensis]
MTEKELRTEERTETGTETGTETLPSEPDREPTEATEPSEAAPGVEDDAWWSGMGPVGGAVLIVLGSVSALFLFLGPWKPDDHLGIAFGFAKVVAVGLVVTGTTLLSRRRGTDGADGEEA